MVHKLAFWCIMFIMCYYLVKTHELKDLTPEHLLFHAVVQAKLVCGGVLITKNYVITPAYCVYGSSLATVYLGFHGYPYYNAHHSEPNTQILLSSNIFVHEDFAKINDEDYLNNIALIKLSTPALLNNKIHPGKLISKEDFYFLDGKRADITGWTVSRDTNKKFATVQIRDQDTCNFLFGHRFLRSQEFCVKWLTKSHLNLMGNPVSVDNKIVGFQTKSPPCVVASSTCSRNDIVLSFIPFLDWMSRIMNISIEQFTYKDQKEFNNPDITKIVSLINIINETIYKEKNNWNEHGKEILILNEKIDNTIAELKIRKNTQNNFALSLNEQIGSIKTEINNSRTQDERNRVKLQEELNSVRTEVSNSLDAQKSFNDSEIKFAEISKNLELKVNKQIDDLGEKIRKLTNITQNNQIKENEHHLQQEQEIDDLNNQLSSVQRKELKNRDEIDEKISNVENTIHKVLDAQNSLQMKIEDLPEELAIFKSKDKESLTKLQEEVNTISHNVHKNLIQQHSWINEIKNAFGEQRNDMDKYIIQEFSQNRLLWEEIKLLNNSINKIKDVMYEEPIPN